eukprot:CAMPEP_0185040126 /NCGR_PEP_ID=MMETSP1103-20130426/37827_1 /TAXON_ID=36769 /ORGANISM="Paraphysomonas bandaiensis, Strain Caron Lab Isolate" /LENGTH=105 /DNA_ID=CAMNT_0027579305 /DNA_START=74 /DNA_END=391 /DNA_ORIENTATION=-
MNIDPQTQIELEAAAFRKLRQHLLEKRPDVQNIDLMNLSGFCRNCLSRWYQEAANERGIDMTKDQGREMFYGMPFEDWKRMHQTEADSAKQEAFKKAHAENVENK